MKVPIQTTFFDRYEMNTANTEIKRWGIVVIQSLNSEDIKTGESLYKDILRYKCYSKKESFSSFYNVHSVQDFRSAIRNIENSLIEGDILTLQVETHGCDEGIGLSCGETLKWKDFYDIIRTLNVKTGHLLFIIMAMCKSIAMISSINPEERAPYRAFICTTRLVNADEIYRGFMAFYENYFNLLDIAQALKALQEEVKDKNGFSPFQALTAESVFDETFDPNRTNFTEVVKAQLTRLNIPISATTESVMSNDLQKLLAELHDKFYNYYNFKDLY